MIRLALVGCGGHAKVVLSLIMKLNKYDIMGYIDKSDKGNLFGIPYLGDDNYFLENYKNKISTVVLGLGQIKTLNLRKGIVEKYIKADYEFETIISPSAIINRNVEIGTGTVIMDGVVINPDTRIGEYSIINTNSTVEHDCRIGNFVHIAPGTTLSGGVNIGDNCFIGIGSNVIQNINISSNVLLGAGSTVYKDIKDSGVYVGNPLKKIK